MRISHHSLILFLFCLFAIFCAQTANAEVAEVVLEVYSAPTGAGKVYISETTDTPADSCYKSSDIILTSFDAPDTLYVFAKPSDGYGFCGWAKSEDGNIISTEMPYKVIQIPNEEQTFYARFGVPQVIALLPAKGGAYTVATFDSVYHAGDTAVTASALCLEAKAEEGYKFYGWYTTPDGGRTKHFFSASPKVDYLLFTDSTTLGAEFVEARVPLPSPTAMSNSALTPLMYVNQLNNDAYYGARANWRSFRFDEGGVMVSQVIKQYSDSATGYPYDDMRLGAYHFKNRKYYSILVHNDGQGNYPVSFCEVDVATGDTSVIRYFTADEQSAWYAGDSLLVGMAYNPANDTLYALGQKTVSDTVNHTSTIVSAIYSVDTDSGKIVEVKILGEKYNEFCFDLHGHCYLTAAKPISEADTTSAGTPVSSCAGTMLEKRTSDFSKLSSVELMVDTNACVQTTIGALAIDYKTGDMYWLSAKDYLSPYTLRKIDAATGQCTDIATMPAFDCYTNLFIPAPLPDTHGVPAMVQALDARPNQFGAMEDTLTWINPTITWEGDNLSDITAIRIFRKKAGAATSVMATPAELLGADNADTLAILTDNLGVGQSCQWVDTTPLNGVNTYYVVAVNNSGEGVIDSVRCFVGQDAIAGVDRLVAQKDGENIALKWSAPTRGIHNGFIPTAQLSYNIVRYPDSVVVAENYTDTAFIDTTLGQVERYYYAVQPYCGAEAGVATLTNGLLAGAPIPAPCLLTFLSQSDASRWTFLSDSATSHTDNAGTEYVETDENLNPLHALSFTMTAQSEGELISPPLLLTAEQTYRFTVELGAQSPDGSFSLSTGIATNDADTLRYELLRPDTIVAPTANRVEIEDQFTPTQTGVYYYRLKIAPQVANTGNNSMTAASQVANSGNNSMNAASQVANSGNNSMNAAPQANNAARYYIFSLSVDDITGLGSATDGSSPAASATIVGYYDLRGVKQGGLRRGINLVKYSDGTVKKLFVK